MSGGRLPTYIRHSLPESPIALYDSEDMDNSTNLQTDIEHYDGNYTVVNERHGYELKERAQNLYGVRFHLRAAFSNINPPPSFHDCTFYSTYV